MAERKILKAVHARRKLYRVGSSDQEKEELNNFLTPDRAEELKERGVLSGAWSGNKKASEAEHLPAERPGPARGQGVQRKYGEEAGKKGEVETDREPSTTGTALPSGFPGRTALLKAGYDTQEKVNDADDDELEALEGIGGETVKKIRETLK